MGARRFGVAMLVAALMASACSDGSSNTGDAGSSTAGGASTTTESGNESDNDDGGDGDDDGAADETGDEPSSDSGADTPASPPDEVPLATLASLEFLGTLSTGSVAQAESYLVSEPFDDPNLGAPYDPDLLAARLPDIADLVGRGELRPGPGGLDRSEQTGVGCRNDSGVVCAVDVVANTEILATILVHWDEGGVSDLTVVARNDDGAAAGIGGSVCSDGFTLVHGGQTPERYDIAVCADGAGSAEYVGSVRNTDLDIRLDACAVDAQSWQGTNGGTRYVVANTDGTGRSSIEVRNSNGTLVESGLFTSVEPAAAPPVPPCS